MSLHLIATSYHNIGPSTTPLTVVFHSGVFLIKAPVGTGKSFLFFDAPAYGLYKHEPRPILNTKSIQGYIKILFRMHEDDFLCVRQLRKGKQKTSCTSRLFRINTLDKTYTLQDRYTHLPERFPHINTQQPQKPLTHIYRHIDIQDILSKHTDKINAEEIIFKNETELQQHIQSFLPEKEAFLRTVFLMQDAENIFELQPTDRLRILKHVFNLLGVDEAKERIQEHKRQLTAEKKVIGDTSLFDIKVKKLLTTYLETIKTCEDHPILHNQFHPRSDTIQELTHLCDKITIQSLSIDHLPYELYTHIHTIYTQHTQKALAQNTKLQTLRTQLQYHKNKQDTLSTTLQQLQQQYSQITDTLSQTAQTSIEELQSQKRSLYSNREHIVENFPSPAIIERYEQQRNTRITQENNILLDQNSDIQTCMDFLLQCIQLGTLLKQEIHNYQQRITSAHEQHTLRIQQHHQDIKQQHAYIQLHIQKLQEKQADFQQRKRTIEEQITTITHTRQQQSNFSCERIKDSCPFIQQINKQSLHILEQQKKDREHKLEERHQDYKKENIENQIIEQQKQLEALSHTPPPISTHSSDIQGRQESIEQATKIFDSIKQFFGKHNWTNLQTLHTQYTQLTKEIDQLQKHIDDLQQREQQHQTLLQEQTKIQTSIEHTQSLITENNTVYTTHQETIQLLEQELLQSNNLSSLGTAIEELQHIHRTRNQLIEDYKTQQIRYKELIQQEKIASDLYTIFSKDLLSVILEDSMQALSDIMNNFLAHVVDFTISFHLQQYTSDKIELHVSITDTKGKRDIKSLSGGQKVLIKLTWMLTIAAYTQASMLFLDETINNLDTDMISNVAQMLEDFVKRYTISLYTVTHSQHIQQMHIWDNIITLESI